MPVYRFYPEGDKFDHGGFITDPFSGVLFDKVDEVGLGADCIIHVPFSSGFSGSDCELYFQDPSVIALALSYYGVVRIHSVRITAAASLLEASAGWRFTLGLHAGAPATTSTPLLATRIEVPGTVVDSFTTGVLPAETIALYEGDFALYDTDDTEFTLTDLDSGVAMIQGFGSARLYGITMDVDMRIGPTAIPATPHYQDQRIGIWQPIIWRFHNGGDGVQKKYRIMVFELTSQWNAYAGAVYASGTGDLSGEVAMYDSGVVRSSANQHDFSTAIGSKKIRGIANGQYVVAVRVAKDYKGSDWWSPWKATQFIIDGPGTTTVTVPVEGAVGNSSRIGITYTHTGIPRRQSERRIYEIPADGWDGFDPDLTDQEPFWSAILDGPDAVDENPLEYSIPNGTYRIYMRSSDVTFADWTEWDYNNFTMDAPNPPAPELFITTNTAQARVEYEIDFSSAIGATDGALNDVQEVTLDRETVDNGILPVRLFNSTIADGLLPDSVYLPGTAFSAMALANNTSFHTANLDVTVSARPPSWSSYTTVALAARWEILAGNFRSWAFILRSDGKLQLKWSTNGTAETTAISTVALPVFPARQFVYLRAILNVSNPYNVTFRYSTDDTLPLASWTLLGSAVVGGAATSIFNNTSNGFVESGATSSGLGDLGPIFIRSFRLRSTIDGSTNTIYFNTNGTLATTYQHGFFLVGNNPAHHFNIRGYDVEIPLKKFSTYTAQYKVLFTTDNEYRWSDVDTATATINSDQTWMAAVEDPLSSRRFLAAEVWHDYESTKQTFTNRAFGRTLPISQQQAGRGDSFSFPFTVIGEQANEDLIAILESGTKLVLRTPKRTWYVVPGNYQTKSLMYDLRQGEEDTRVVSCQLTEVSAF